MKNALLKEFSKATKWLLVLLKLGIVLALLALALDINQLGCEPNSIC